MDIVDEQVTVFFHRPFDGSFYVSASDFTRRIAGGPESSPGWAHWMVSCEIVCDRKTARDLLGLDGAHESVCTDPTSVIRPAGLGVEATGIWAQAVEQSLHGYRRLLSEGVLSIHAQSLLPECVATKTWVTASLATWAQWFGAAPPLSRIMTVILKGIASRLSHEIHGRYTDEDRADIESTFAELWAASRESQIGGCDGE